MYYDMQACLYIDGTRKSGTTGQTHLTGDQHDCGIQAPEQSVTFLKISTQMNIRIYSNKLHEGPA